MPSDIGSGLLWREIDIMDLGNDDPRPIRGDDGRRLRGRPPTLTDTGGQDGVKVTIETTKSTAIEMLMLSMIGSSFDTR